MCQFCFSRNAVLFKISHTTSNFYYHYYYLFLEIYKADKLLIDFLPPHTQTGLSACCKFTRTDLNVHNGSKWAIFELLCTCCNRGQKKRSLFAGTYRAVGERGEEAAACRVPPQPLGAVRGWLTSHDSRDRCLNIQPHTQLGPHQSAPAFNP